MDLPNEPERQREFGQTFQAMTHSRDIAGDFLDIVQRNSRSFVVLEEQKVIKARLGSFDLRGEDGLFPDIRIDEQAGNWQRIG